MGKFFVDFIVEFILSKTMKFLSHENFPLYASNTMNSLINVKIE